MGQGELEQGIRERIRREGAIGFDEFMETALYDPEGGFYAAGGREVTGRRGDYFTSVSVGNCFGRILAEQFAEVWKRMGCPGRFTVVEQGGHDGQLAEDILEAAEEGQPEMFASVEYVLVEPLESMREAQRERLETRPEERVRWVSRLEDLGGLRGIYFCNELVDAFPFKRVRCEKGRWRELGVGIDDEGAFQWEIMEGEPGAELSAELQKMGSDYPDGYTSEICLRADAWMEALAGAMDSGVAFIIDYGFPREEYYARERIDGTLRCYQDHRASEDPFREVGARDITAHVDFTRLAEAAEANGWQIGGFTDQHHFLVGAAEDWLRAQEGQSGTSGKWQRQFQALTHPGMMGRSFKVLGLSRGLEGEEKLRGFRFSGHLGEVKGVAGDNRFEQPQGDRV